MKCNLSLDHPVKLTGILRAPYVDKPAKTNYTHHHNNIEVNSNIKKKYIYCVCACMHVCVDKRTELEIDQRLKPSRNENPQVVGQEAGKYV